MLLFIVVSVNVLSYSIASSRPGMTLKRNKYSTSAGAGRRQTNWLFQEHGYLQHDPGDKLESTEKQLKEINTSTSADRRQTSRLFTIW